MIEKTKKILISILGVILVVAIVYSAIALVINIFKEPDILTKEELALYMIESNIVRDHTTFYYLSDCLDNVAESVKREKIDELYELYMKDYKKVNSKADIYSELKEFGVNGAEYKLQMVYKLNSAYILVYDLNGQTRTMLMTFDTKLANYLFAIIK